MVFTIHNAEFGLDRIGMAAYYSQRFTTVSPTYAYEVCLTSAADCHEGVFCSTPLTGMQKQWCSSMLESSAKCHYNLVNA